MSIVLDGTSGITTPQVITDDGEAYAPGNILGTVSQTAGVPTGAIIQRGSNANGEFVRYADGTQICTRTADATTSFSRSNHFGSSAGTMFAINPATRSWPSAFSEVPQMLIQDQNSGTTETNAVAVLVSVTCTEEVFRVGVYHKDNGKKVTFSVTGIGRWF